MRHSLLAFLLSLTLLSCKEQSSGISVIGDPAITVGSLTYIGEQKIAFNTKFNGTTVGGLSSIDYVVDSTWYVMCDDPADSNAVRYYTATLSYTASAFNSVTLTNVVTLKQPDGTDFPKIPDASKKAIDPETMRLDIESGNLLWVSEGYRKPGRNPTLLADPFLRECKKDGAHVREFALPAILKMDTLASPAKGPRANGAFEGLTLSRDRKSVFAAMEEPLNEDGTRSTADSNGVVRFIKYDKASGAPSAQYAYRMEKLVPTPSPATAFFVHGVTEILAMSDTKLLVVERSFAVGGVPDYNIRIYEADLAGATDVSSLSSLAGATYTPATKRLIFDLATLGLTRIDNIEGITFGPRLANGNLSLVLISDDNFSASQITQFLLFEVKP